MADSVAGLTEIPQKPPHRRVEMGEDMGRVGETVQTLKLYTDEIFASEGWKELTLEEAQNAYKEKRSLFGLYDPAETTFTRANSSNAARIIVKLEGRNTPIAYNFKTIKYYLEEVE